MDRLGLIAGGGRFPVVFAREAGLKGAKVIAYAIKDVTDPELETIVHKIHWYDMSKFSVQMFALTLFADRIKNMVMAGKVDKSVVFKVAGSNSDVSGLINSARDRMDYSLLDEITRRFGQIGIKIIDGLEFLSDIVPQKGVLTQRHPSPEEMGDVEFGTALARELARLDIGQTITVKNKAVVSIEGMEGTDEAIRRAGTLVKGGFTVIKMARPKQDMRWDVPMVGPDTVRAMMETGARVLALESGKMFLIEKPQVIKLADDHDITILAV